MIRLTPLLLCLAVLCAGCAAAEQEVAPLPQWSFAPEMIVPGDGSLVRPEDGVVLPDGRLLVADQAHGLRLLSPDGSSRPFGNLAAAGYQHDPPRVVGGANGVALEPSGAHVLVTDVYRGGIYRVDIASETSELIYQHQYGVNSARADRSGGIWFTQSTQNSPERGEEELWRAVDSAIADGALLYLAPPGHGGERGAAVPLAEGLFFANGIALDEDAGYLYLAETLGGRVSRYRLDVAAGRVSDPKVILEILGPDNIELDPHGRLWIAAPLRSEIVVFDPSSDVTRSVFRISSPDSERTIEAIEARLRDGLPWLELMTPVLWEPGPGAITGIILSPADGPVHVTGLGTALIRLDR
jgi:sugar lactone lactonase YvrE